MFKSGFFKDGTGAQSMMRLVMFLLIFVILSVWFFLNLAGIVRGIKDPALAIGMVDFAPQVMYVLGMAIAGKIGQGVFENKSDNKSESGEQK